MTRRTIVGLAVLALLGSIFCVWMLRDDPPVAPTLRESNAPAPNPTASTTRPEPTTAPLPSGLRENAAPAATEPPAATPLQGFRGVVVDEANAPLADVAVHLLDSASNEPLALPWILQQRLPLAPLASGRTARDGTFAIGLPVAQDKEHDLFFLAANHAAFRLTNLRMQPDQWFDVGTLVMVPGVDVRGRVTVEGSGAPVPGAVVSIEAGASFVDAALRALPSGDRGLATKVDAAGRFVLRNTPRLGVVRLAAVAQGFARVVRGNVNLSGSGPVELDFVLPPGVSLAGRVVDERGAAIAGARIAAFPKRRSEQPFVASSEHDGRFVLQHLTAGEYDVRVEARGYQEHQQSGVVAGRDDLDVALVANGSARIRVLTRSGAAVRDFHVALRRFLPENGDRLAFVADVPEQRARLEGAEDFVTIVGVPSGTFVAQIDAEGYATTFSAPFELDATRRTRDVDVVVSAGATLFGTVLDEAGRPLADATVTTEPDGADPDSPTWRVLAAAVPDRITKATATTDANGRFVMPALAFADYQLAIHHPEACSHRERGIRLDTEGERTLAPIRVLRGALVTGRATFGGAVAPRMKIVLRSPSNAASRPGSGLRLETFTAPDGAFRFPMRVPPGMYELRAAVVDTADTPGGHFRHLQQLQRSAMSLVVAAGQDRIERDIDLPNDH